MRSNQKRNPRSMTGENRLLIFLAFACIYVIWGSTYLAIRYAVETIPPLFVAGFRHLIAGGLLFGWCWWRGFRPTREQWRASIVLAVLFFLIGHGTLHWAQQTLPSGLAALLIATEPIFVAIILTATRRARFTGSLLIGLLLGLFGVALIILECRLHSTRSEYCSSLLPNTTVLTDCDFLRPESFLRPSTVLTKSKHNRPPISFISPADDLNTFIISTVDKLPVYF